MSQSRATRTWIESGFEAFADGTFGNAGQNLYVSRAGVLQRIFHYDFDGDGRADLVLCNSQNHWEQPPAYVYTFLPSDPARRTELPADGGRSGVVADLNGDGYDDLVIANHYNGIGHELSAFIYYGSPEGLSEKRHQRLPAPCCTSAAAGDFNGDGRIDLAFVCRGKVRIFYQTSLGFEPKRFTDLELEGKELAGADLDEDGFTDLLVRDKDGAVRVYWGGPNGIDSKVFTLLPVEPDPPAADTQQVYAESVEDAEPLVKVIRLENTNYVFVPRSQKVWLIPVVYGARQFGAPRMLNCPNALSVAVGDVNGDGHLDLVFACRDAGSDGERSWIYWSGPDGFSEARRTSLAGHRACDVVVGDLDGDGCAEIILCQNHTAESFTSSSRVFRGTQTGVVNEPIELVTEDARRVFLLRGPDDPHPQVAFINYFSRDIRGNIPAYVYFNGPDGFSADRRRELKAFGSVESLGCDFNDDGRPDLVLANAAENAVSCDPGSFVYISTSDGLPTEDTWILPTVRAHGVCCADLNRDGYLDLIFCGFDNPELVIFYGSAKGFDIEHPVRIRLEHEGTVYKEPRWIYLADLNNDGWLDLVVPEITAERSFILWGGPEGFSMDRCQALSATRAACARAADLIGNGYLDLILGGHTPSVGAPHDSFVYIYWNGPDGLREDRRTLLPSAGVNAISVADFNRDGLLDMFVCSYHDGKNRDIDSYIYWNRPGLGFRAADRTRMFTHSASGSLAVDFNEDGWPDLAVAYHKVDGDHVGYSAVWQNGPEGFSEQRITRLPCMGPHGITAVEPGNQRDRGSEEYYVSSPYQLPDAARVTRVDWDADVPPKTWVRAQLRFASSREGLDAAAWQGPDGSAAWFENRQAIGVLKQTGPWVQYRLALGATNGCGSPRVRKVTVEYKID